MTYTFATRTRFHGAPVVLIGSGDTEEAALRDALDRDLGIDYRDHDGYHMTRTVIDCDPELFDEAVGLAIKDARGAGSRVVHVRFDTQTENDRLVYVAHVLIRDAGPKGGNGATPSTRDGQEGA